MAKYTIGSSFYVPHDKNLVHGCDIIYKVDCIEMYSTYTIYKLSVYYVQCRNKKPFACPVSSNAFAWLFEKQLDSLELIDFADFV